VDLGKLVALQGVREYPSRVKCATLAWHALAAAINDDSKPATTE
jgi:nitrogen fixation NifU-like protein